MSSGDSAEFYKTSNGGKTWVLVYKNYTQESSLMPWILREIRGFYWRPN